MLGLLLEIVHDTVLNIEGLDIPRLRRVCRQWRDIIDSSTILQLTIELAVDGKRIVPGSMNRQSAKELFEHVQKSNASWESLIPQRIIPFNFCAGRVMTQLCEGLFAHGMHGQGRGRETLNRADVRRSLEFLDLFRFKSRFDLPPNFSHVDLSLNILNFYFDCAQDLLLLYALRGGKEYLHVRTLSTNEPHPDASALSCFILESEYAPERVHFHIWGDTVAFIRNVDPLGEYSSLTIVNWRRTEVVLFQQINIIAFCLLNQHAGLMVVWRGRADFLFQFISWDEEYCTITLKLPRLQVGWEIVNLHMAPTKSTLSRISPSAPGCDSVLYLTDDPELILFVISVRSSHGADSEVLLVINRREFLYHVKAVLGQRYAIECHGPPEELIWEWHAWNRTARFIPLGGVERPWLVSGWRIIGSVGVQGLEFSTKAFQLAATQLADEGISIADENEDTKRLVILDFNPYRVRCSRPVPKTVIEWQLGKTGCWGMAAESIDEGLPFVARMEKRPSHSKDIRCTRDLIVEFKNPHYQHEGDLHGLVFLY